MTVRGLAQVTRNLKAYDDKIQQAIVDAVNATAQAVRTSAIKRVQQSPATGRVYEKYNPRRTHQASSAGNPPRTDTGALAKGIRAALASKRNKTAQVGAIASTDYAFWLEFGTRHMDERPFMIPSLTEHGPTLDRMLEHFIGQATR